VLQWHCNRCRLHALPGVATRAYAQDVESGKVWQQHCMCISRSTTLHYRCIIHPSYLVSSPVISSPFQYYHKSPKSTLSNQARLRSEYITSTCRSPFRKVIAVEQKLCMRYAVYHTKSRIRRPSFYIPAAVELRKQRFK
jgi:hypothetical protein